MNVQSIKKILFFINSKNSKILLEDFLIKPSIFLSNITIIKTEYSEINMNGTTLNDITASNFNLFEAISSTIMLSGLRLL